MGKTTEKNYRELKSAEKYENAKLTGMMNSEFTTILDRYITKKKVRTAQIVDYTGFCKSYINKLHNPSARINCRIYQYAIKNIIKA